MSRSPGSASPKVVRAVRFVACLAAGAAVAAPAPSEKGVEPKSMKPVARVIEDNSDRLLRLAGVVGLAEGFSDGKPCIQVLVEHRTPELDAKLPTTLEGYQVVVRETGAIRPLPTHGSP